jgi:hypothetical protein
MGTGLRCVARPIAPGGLLMLTLMAVLGPSTAQTPRVAGQDRFLKRTSAWELTGAKTPDSDNDKSNPPNITCTNGRRPDDMPSVPTTNSPVGSMAGAFPGLPIVPKPHLTPTAHKSIKQLPRTGKRPGSDCWPGAKLPDFLQMPSAHASWETKPLPTRPCSA